MKRFPEYMIPANIENFNNYIEAIYISELREKIYKYVLTGDYDTYFILENFYRSENINKEMSTRITSKLVDELHQLGWKTKIVFGGTSIYIYDKEPHKSDLFDDII